MKNFGLKGLVNGFRDRTARKRLDQLRALETPALPSKVREIAEIQQDYNGLMLQYGHHVRRMIDMEDVADRMLEDARKLEAEAKIIGEKAKAEAEAKKNPPAAEPKAA